MSISDYVKMHDIDGMNAHFRKAIRSLLKLHQSVFDEHFNGRLKLIDAMLLAWLPHPQQLEWLPRVLNSDVRDLAFFLRLEPSS